MPFYAVARGRQSGIFSSWPECESMVKGYTGARYKKFNSASEAQNFIDMNTSAVKSSNFQKNSNTLASSCKQNVSESNRKRTIMLSNPPIAEKKCKRSGSFEKDDDGYVKVWTDGSCTSNGQNGAKAGLGVYFGEDHKLNVSRPVSGRATNNCGEIQAATEAIKLAKQNGIKKISINTDSQFLINSITKWMPGWKSKGWKLKSGEPVKNQKDFQELEQAMKQVQVKWNYVEAHKGIYENEKADQLAKAGAAQYNVKS